MRGNISLLNSDGSLLVPRFTFVRWALGADVPPTISPSVLAPQNIYNPLCRVAAGGHGGQFESACNNFISIALNAAGSRTYSVND
jgi:hypothetical protein